MKLRRNLSGIFDKLEGEEKPIPTCIEDCTPETRLKWLEGLALITSGIMYIDQVYPRQ